MRLRVLWFVVIIMVAAGPWPLVRPSTTHQRQQATGRTVTGVIKVQRVFPEVEYAGGSIRADRAGNICILRTGDNSISIYDRQHKFVRRIGQIGKGPGEFTEPFDFIVGHGGEFYVADSGNHRVQVLDSKGRFLRQFRFRVPISIAILSNGQILVVGQNDDQLIRVFSPEGKFLRTIGTPVELGLTNRQLNAYLNRGRVLVDQKDNVYYLFRALPNPTVRKYSADGKLLMEIHPEGTEMPEIRRRAEAKLADTIKKGTISSESTLNAIQIDSATGNIWIAPAGPIVYVYSPRGQKLAEYRLQDVSGRANGAVDLLLIGRKGYFTNGKEFFVFDVPRVIK